MTKNDVVSDRSPLNLSKNYLISTLGKAKQWTILVDLLDRETEPDIASHIIRVLGALGNQEVIPILEQKLAITDDPSIKKCIESAISSLNLVSSYS